MGFSRAGFHGALHFYVMLLISGALPGCVLPDRMHTAARYDAGLVLILPGIEGSSIWNLNLAAGLDEGAVPHALEIFDWTRPGLSLVNLSDEALHRGQALRLAERITDYRRNHAAQPVILLAHSGGALVALLALEDLPEKESVDSVILLAPAVSPSYDLTPALRRVRLAIYNFYSERDWQMLGAGTSLFGTADRVFGHSAGMEGFRHPVGVPELTHRLYDLKLKQVAWTPQIARYGADGSHVGWTTVKFAREYLRCIVRNEPLPEPGSAESHPSKEIHK